MFELYFETPFVATHLYNILDRHVFLSQNPLTSSYVFTILIIFQYAVNHVYCMIMIMIVIIVA